MQPLPFDKRLIDTIRINRSAVEFRAATLPARRTFKNVSQAAALLRAVECLDLTTLSGDDTPGKVERLCAKALHPIDAGILRALGRPAAGLRVGAVCVYANLVPSAVRTLNGALPVAAVSTGFPAGQIPLDLKVREIEGSIASGATEIDVVISRDLVLTGRWKELYDQVKLFCELCASKARVKTILGVGNLGTLGQVAQASAVAIMAGSDFIKTSTGFEPVNATLGAGLVMIRQIRRFRDLTGGKRLVGFKPAGGIRTAKEAMGWMLLMLEELGEAWTRPSLFRIGASGLLTDIERQLHHLATGRYSAAHHHALG